MIECANLDIDGIDEQPFMGKCVVGQGFNAFTHIAHIHSNKSLILSHVQKSAIVIWILC